jgi:dihydroorotase
MFDQGFPPDVISSDLHLGLSVKTSGWPGMPSWDLPTTMSKMLSLGMELDDVIRASTYTPAKTIGCESEFGSLREGSAADVTVLELKEGRFEFQDTYSGQTAGDRRLVPFMTIRAGEVLGIPRSSQ